MLEGLLSGSRASINLWMWDEGTANGKATTEEDRTNRPKRGDAPMMLRIAGGKPSMVTSRYIDGRRAWHRGGRLTPPKDTCGKK